MNVYCSSANTRLESQGTADFYLCEPREVQLQKLVEYRDEMRAFTEFLKTIYFSQYTEDESDPSSKEVSLLVRRDQPDLLH